jgi:hypothetical protein
MHGILNIKFRYIIFIIQNTVGVPHLKLYLVSIHHFKQVRRREICSSQGCDIGDLFGSDADLAARIVLRLLWAVKWDVWCSWEIVVLLRWIKLLSCCVSAHVYNVQVSLRVTCSAAISWVETHSTSVAGGVPSLHDSGQLLGTHAGVPSGFPRFLGPEHSPTVSAGKCFIETFHNFWTRLLLIVWPWLILYTACFENWRSC